MMEYNVAQLLKDPIGATRDHKVDGDIYIDEGGKEKVNGSLYLMRTDAGIWANANLKLAVWATCARCLEQFRMPVSIQIEEEYLPTVDISNGKSLKSTHPHGDWPMIDYRHMLNLDEMIRQHTIMRSPLKPLCREDCQRLLMIKFNLSRKIPGEMNFF